MYNSSFILEEQFLIYANFLRNGYSIMPEILTGKEIKNLECFLFIFIIYLNFWFVRNFDNFWDYYLKFKQNSRENYDLILSVQDILLGKGKKCDFTFYLQ